MPYPIISNNSARRWWNTWSQTGLIDEPPPLPETETSAEGDSRDWQRLVSDLMDGLGNLYDTVDGSGDGMRGQNSTTQSKSSGNTPPKKAARMNNDRFEAAACVLIHRALPRDPALADPEFWIWMATTPGLGLVRRRYSGKKIPDRLNFTSANARETLFYRLWIRAELAHDPSRIDDPYELAGYGDIDFWRSHVLRQMWTESRPMLAAFIRFQHPNGPDGGKRLTQKEIRELVKNVRRAATNVMVEVLDEQDATKFLEEQWRKI